MVRGGFRWSLKRALLQGRLQDYSLPHDSKLKVILRLFEPWHKCESSLSSLSWILDAYNHSEFVQFSKNVKVSGKNKVEELRVTAVLCTSVTWRIKWHLKQFKTLLYFIKHAKLIFAASGHENTWTALTK